MSKDSIRKTRSDGDKTKERILKAALALFAKHGFAETENKEIAKKAKVDIASINYHFGSRKGLFEAVLIRAHQNLVSLEALEAIQRSDMKPEEKLRGVFNLITGAARRGERASLQVISRSVIAPGAALETLFKKEARPKLQVILQIVSEITEDSGRPPPQPLPKRQTKKKRQRSPPVPSRFRIRQTLPEIQSS